MELSLKEWLASRGLATTAAQQQPETSVGSPWLHPKPLGYPEAFTAMGLNAAPLLAGFSLTLIGLVVQAERQFRWPSLLLVLLVLAMLFFVFALQCTFHARQFFAPPADWQQWFPGTEFEAARKAGQAHEAQQWRVWVNRARLSYRAGLLALLAALPVLLVPARSHPISAGRWVAIICACAGIATELTWLYSDTRRPKGLRATHAA
jgi:MFS family permease